MKIKLFKDNTQAEPDHEFDTDDFMVHTGQILAVAQTSTHYIFGHKIAGEDAFAFFEAEVVTVNFAIGNFAQSFGPGKISTGDLRK